LLSAGLSASPRVAFSHMINKSARAPINEFISSEQDQEVSRLTTFKEYYDAKHTTSSVKK
jgi:hypothetical protein